MSPGRCSEWAVERDSRGRERLVRSRSAHGACCSPSGYRTELSDAIASIQRMEDELNVLQDRLSREQQRVSELTQRVSELTQRVSDLTHYNEPVRRLEQQIRNLENERDHYLRRCATLEDELKADRRKYKELKEKYKELKHDLSRPDHRIDYYKIRYEERGVRLDEKIQEVELLRQRLRERDRSIRYNEDTIAQMDQSLRARRRFDDYLIAFLRSLGYSVDDRAVR